MTNLEKMIQHAAQKYYQDGTSELSDQQFDEMVDKVRKENPDSEVLRTSWGYNVDQDSTEGERRPHLYNEVGSLRKCHNWNEYNGDFFGDCAVDASLKLDGISVVLYYGNGELIEALTRGDGFTGIDITEKLRAALPSYYIALKRPWSGAIRGEILMSYSKFEEFKRIHPDAKNPRNSTAGLINKKDSADEIAKFLNVVCYSIVGDLNSDYLKTDVRRIRSTLIEFFPEEAVVPHTLIEVNPMSFDTRMCELRSRWYGKYPADGIVLTKLVADHMPNGAVTYDAKAFKFPSEELETTVIDVEWAMSKTNYAVPRIHVETVELAGTQVSYCTGYNAAYIRDNFIGPGTKVAIEKRGEIIPNINSVIKSTYAELPDYCPVCGAKLEWVGVHLACTNPECDNQSMQDMLIYLNYIAPVKGLGDNIKLKYLSELLTEFSINALYNARYHFDTIYGDSGHRALMKEMLTKLLDINEKVSAVSALCALNIPRVGEITAKKLIKCKYALLHPDEPGSDHAIQAAVGGATTASIFENEEKLYWLHILGPKIIWEVAESGRVAVTGELSVKRNEFKKELEAAGYTLGDVNKSCIALVCNEISSSSKCKKAQELGIPILTEAQFRGAYLR